MARLVAFSLLALVACKSQASVTADAGASPMPSAAPIAIASAAPTASGLAPLGGSLPAHADPGADDQFHVVQKPAAREGNVTFRCTTEPDDGCICNGLSLDPCATKTSPTMTGHQCTYACAATDHVVRLKCLTGIGVAPTGCTCGDGIINPCAGGKSPKSVKRDGSYCAVTCE